MNRDCFEFEELISAAIDGELDVDEFGDLETHVDHCDECRKRYQRMETVNDWLVAHERSSLACKSLLETSSRITLDEKPIVNGCQIESPLIGAATATLPISSKSSIEKNSILPLDRHPSRHRRRLGLAGGALAAVGLAALLSTSSTDTSLPDIDPGELSASVQQVTVLNHQTQRAQVSQTKTLELELRALRLQLRNTSCSPDEMAIAIRKLDSIENRLKQLDEP